MSNRQPKRGLALLLVLTGSLLLPCSPGHAEDLPSAARPQADEQRLLVIAPHPDDESLAGAALIQQTLQRGGSVRVAVLTNGDGFRRAAAEQFHLRKAGATDLYRLGLLRQQEELTAAKRLGLQEQDVLFLGYPDAGLRHLWSGHFWSSRSPYTGLNGFDRVPYRRAYQVGNPYCGQALADDLRRILTEFRPTHVLYPDPHDVHGDHWAASAFTQYALAGLPLKPSEATYLIHYPQFPKPQRYRPGQALLQPKKLSGIGIRWRQVPLGVSEVEQKRSAVLAHRSQIQVMNDFLTSFVRQNDLVASSCIPQLQNCGPAVELLDPAGDQSGDGAADIRKLTVSRFGQQLRLCIQLASPVTAGHRFTVRLRMPEAGPGETSQLEVKLHNRKLNIIPFPELNSRVQSPVFWQLQQDRFVLTLPLSTFHDLSCLMVGAEVKLGSAVDRTAWRRLYL
ncbi:LmbE family N-acetylglucosaminyl deacetylase [Tumebacillus sp. BK434]|uniref:PIG-L deacetylase family protein n=1 Tax=Tumebacillus sp. BK434 TaxID=2512169 RepID=UPI0010D99D8D|nr:PIG-L family deacetylase [Tumebacillus sp. BK434]TCP53722.1 LmbE family N-acetylglucosaminyl deacetylase [Tumebacillus sp. BK434]